MDLDFPQMVRIDFLFIYVFITNIFIQGATIQTELFYHDALYIKMHNTH